MEWVKYEWGDTDVYLRSTGMPVRMKGKTVMVPRWVNWLYTEVFFQHEDETRAWREAKTSEDIEALMIMRGLAE